MASLPYSSTSALIRTASHIAGVLIDAAFANRPEAYCQSQCDAIKSGVCTP